MHHLAMGQLALERSNRDAAHEQLASAVWFGTKAWADLDYTLMAMLALAELGRVDFEVFQGGRVLSPDAWSRLALVVLDH